MFLFLKISVCYSFIFYEELLWTLHFTLLPQETPNSVRTVNTSLTNAFTDTHSHYITQDRISMCIQIQCSCLHIRKPSSLQVDMQNEQFSLNITGIFPTVALLKTSHVYSVVYVQWYSNILCFNINNSPQANWKGSLILLLLCWNATNHFPPISSLMKS